MMRIHREYVYTAVIKNEVIDGQESSRVIVQQEILGQESGETVVVYEEALVQSDYGIDFYIQAQGNTLYLLINQQNVDTDPGTILTIYAYDTRTRTMDTVAEGTYPNVFVTDFMIQEDTAYITLNGNHQQNYLLSCDLQNEMIGSLQEISMDGGSYTPALQRDVIVGYRGTSDPAYFIGDLEGNLIRQGNLPQAEGQEETIAVLMGRLDDGILFTLSSSFGEQNKETLLLVPLDPTQEVETLWEEEVVPSAQ